MSLLIGLRQTVPAAHSVKDTLLFTDSTHTLKPRGFFFFKALVGFFDLISCFLTKPQPFTSSDNTSLCPFKATQWKTGASRFQRPPALTLRPS